MNIILDKLPKSVEIDNKVYRFSTDFRTSILFELAMFDDELSEEEKVIQALQLYFDDNIPYNKEEAIKAIKWFYSCGKKAEEQSKKSTNRQKNIFNYEYDAEYIYSAFMHDYKIDLNKIRYLHWWKFKALFNGLNEDNKLIKIMGYRSIDLRKISDKDEKQRYRELQKLYALPQPKEDKQKLEEINNILLNGGDLSRIL